MCPPREVFRASDIPQVCSLRLSMTPSVLSSTGLPWCRLRVIDNDTCMEVPKLLTGTVAYGYGKNQVLLMMVMVLMMVMMVLLMTTLMMIMIMTTRDITAIDNETEWLHGHGRKSPRNPRTESPTQLETEDDRCQQHRSPDEGRHQGQTDDVV